MKKMIYLLLLIVLFSISLVSASSQTFTVSWVVPTVDVTPPAWVNLRNFTHTVNSSFAESITASDASGIDTYFLNDTLYFNISSAGLMNNVSNLSVIEIFWLNISANDTEGNLVSGVFFINITEEAVTVVAKIFKIYPSVTNQVPHVKLKEDKEFP